MALGECALTTAAKAPSVLLIVALLLNWFGPAHADSPPPPDPTERWELDFDSGVLYSVGSRASPLDYTFLPQILTLKSGAVMRRKLGAGDLVVRNRFSLLVEPIVSGPETHYIGIAAAPSIEWWNAARTFSTFFSIGGGFGWMDSRRQCGARGPGTGLQLQLVHARRRAHADDRAAQRLAGGVLPAHLQRRHELGEPGRGRARTDARGRVALLAQSRKQAREPEPRRD